MDRHALLRRASGGSAFQRPAPPVRDSTCAVSRRQHLMALLVGVAPLIARQPASASTAPAKTQDLVAAAITDVTRGTGPKIKWVQALHCKARDIARRGPGELVMIDVVGKTEGGQVFLDTRSSGKPLAFEVGRTNKYVTPGLTQAVASMSGGDVKTAIVPASLGYGDRGAELPQGSVPPNSKLVYEVEVLRCQTFTLGLACCSEASFPCIGPDSKAAAAQAAALEAAEKAGKLRP